MPTPRRSALLLAAVVALAFIARGSGAPGSWKKERGGHGFERLAPKEGGRSIPRPEHEAGDDDDSAVERYDEPQEARDFYARKRAPVGRRTIPVERYRMARERIAGMAQYSTRDGGFRGRAGVGAAAAALGTWTPLGPGNIGGRTRALALHPDMVVPAAPNTMYAGGAAGGVWKSTDEGASWAPLGDELANLAVSTIALKPGSPNVILAGTGEGVFNLDAVRGAGIFRSTDNGATWDQIEEPGDGEKSDFHYVNKIVFYEGDPNYAFAATNGGVYRSDDGGVSWENILSTTVTGGCLDLAIRTDDDTLFASCGTFDQARVHRTTNATTAGTPNWSSYNPTLDGSGLSTSYLTESRMGRTSLAIAPSNENVVYALAADNETDAFFTLYRSDDGGESWVTRSGAFSPGVTSFLLTNPPFAWPCFGGGAEFFNQGWYDNVVAVDPTDPEVVWAGGIDLFRSGDGGTSFGLASYWWADSSEASYVHSDQHAIVFHPAFNGTTNQQIFFGNDGGIFKTTTAYAATATGDDVCDTTKSGVVFTDLNNGYAITQFYYGAVYPDDRQFLGGTQDNGTIHGSDALGQNGWFELLGGDGGAVGVDPTNTDTLYAENTGASIQKCTLGTACVPNTSDWADATTGISDGGFLFIAPFVMDPSNHLRLFTGGTYLWRTINGANSWQRASSGMSASVTAIGVAPSNGEYVLVGTETGFIHRSSSASTASPSTTWAKVQPRTGYVSSVAFDPYDPNVAYATYSTFNDSTTGPAHVFKSTNAGASWTGLPGTGANKLPDIPVHSIVVDPTQVGRLYIGTDLGIFVTVDGGLNWAQENTQFPGTVAEQLIVSGANLYAFTHGRGVFRVPLTNVAGQTVRLDMVSATSSKPESGAGPVTIQFKVRTSDHANVSGTAPSVTVTAVDGTAIVGDDYLAPTTPLVVPLGTSDGATLSLTVPLLDDAVGEPVETFTVNFTSPSAGLLLSRTTHTVTISNDGDPVGIKVLDLAVTEGNSGTATAAVTVKLNFPADPDPVQVTATTASNTATAPGDYEFRTNTLTFAVGQDTQTFLVPIVGDTVAEPVESFLVNLTSPSLSGVIEDPQAVVTINDNDFSGTLQLSGARFTGTEKTGKAVVTVTRVGGVASGVGFDLVTQDGTAVSTPGAGNDYTTPPSPTFSFAAGATTRTVEIAVRNDLNDEPEESFLVQLSNLTGFGAVLGAQRTAVVTITDNDSAGVLQFTSQTFTGQEAVGNALVTLTRTGGNTGPLTIDVVADPGGTATGGGTDYSGLPATVTFDPGEMSESIVVPLTGDGAPEGNETVLLSLSNPTGGATLGLKSTAILTITDAEPTLFFAASALSASESAKSVLVTVRRAGPLTSTATVDYATSPVTAQPGQDYTHVAGTLTFAPNQPSKTLAVPLISDLIVEGTETLNLTLLNPQGGGVQLGAPSTSVLTIFENDVGGTVAFGLASYTVNEPKTTAPALLKVSVKRTGGTAQDASVLLSSVNGTATAGSDFTAVSKTVTFPAGKTSLTETIQILHDLDAEGPHAFTLTLTNPDGGASLGTPSTATVKIVDNEPTLDWSLAAFSAKEPGGSAVTATALLTIKRTGSTVGDATVQVAVTGGTATLGVDYQFASPLTVNLPSGKPTVTVPVIVNADDPPSGIEGLETATFLLQNPSLNAHVGSLTTATLNITDEEPVMQFAKAVYSVTEPKGATPGNVTITVKRSGNLSLGSSVGVTTSGITAQDGLDFTGATATLNFPSKSSTQTLKIPILPDVDDEPEESFRVELSGAAGGSLGSIVQAEVKIKDNDTAGQLQLQLSVLSVTEAAGNAVVMVTRTAGTGAASVDYATASGVGPAGADSGTDFAATPVSTLSFAAGETSKPITIPITNDGTDEDGEYFTLTLSNPGGGATLGPAVEATIWIVDND